MAQENIRIVVTENGSRVVKRNLESIGTSARTAAGGVNFLQAALAAMSFKAAAGIIDNYTKMQNKLATVTKSQAELTAVTQRLYQVSRNSRVGIDDITDAYFRFNGALEKMGYSQNQVIGLTERISKAFTVAGASAEETNRAMVQLAQGFSKNKLQTQDLKAAMEQAPYVINVLARNLGIAGLSAKQAEFALYSLAEQGKLTTQVMYDAFTKAGPEIQAKFLKTLPTIEQGVIQVQQAFTKWFGQMSTQSGLSRALGEGLLYIADNFDKVAGAVAVFTGALAGIAVAATVLGVVAAAAALLASPFLLAAAAVGAVVTGTLLYSDEINTATGAMGVLRDLSIKAWNGIKEAFTGWFTYFSSKMPKVSTTLSDLWNKPQVAMRNFLVGAVAIGNALVAIFGAAYDTIIEKWKSFPSALYDLIAIAVNKSIQAVSYFIDKTVNFIGSGVSKLLGKTWEDIKSDPGWRLPLTGAAEEAGALFIERLKARMIAAGNPVEIVNKWFEEANAKGAAAAAQLKAKADEVAKATEDLNRARENRAPKIAGDVQILLDNLKKEGDLLKYTNDEYQVRHALLQIEKQLHRDLNDTERGALDTAIRRNIELERRKNLLESIRAPQTEYKQGIADLQALMADGLINQYEFNAALDQMTLKFLNALPPATTFAEGYTRQLQIMTLETKNATGILGTEFAKIFGPGGSLATGIADAVAQSIVFGKSWKESIRGVAQSILSQLISAIVKMGVNMLLQGALGQAQMASLTAAGTAQAATLAGAYTPAATMASLATGGANAAGAATGITSIVTIMGSLVGVLGGFFKGFKDGGYTGPVGTNQVAGLVHGQEFVMNATATRKHRATLEALNSGRDLAMQVPSAPAQPVNVSISNEIPDAAYEVRALSETDVEIIAKRIVQRDAPGVIANENRNPNSRVSKSFTGNFSTSRRR